MTFCSMKFSHETDKYDQLDEYIVYQHHKTQVIRYCQNKHHKASHHKTS